MARLRKDYSNWWELAGDLYASDFGGDTVQAQRMAFELQRANPGVNRFYRGMSVKKPAVPRGGPVITHEQMAQARGESPAEYLGALQQQLGTLPRSAQDFAGRYGVQGTGGFLPPPSGAGATPEGVPGVTETPQPPRPNQLGAVPPALTASPWEGTSATLPDLDIYSYFYGPQYSEAAQEFYRPPGAFEFPERTQAPLQTRGQQRYNVEAIQSQRGVDVTRRARQATQQVTDPTAAITPGLYDRPVTRPAWLERLLTSRGGAGEPRDIAPPGFISRPATPSIGVPGGVPQEQLEPRVREFQQRQETRQRLQEQVPEPASTAFDEAIIPLIGRAAPDDYDWLADWIIDQGADPNDPASLNELFSRVDDITGYMLRMVGIAELAPETEQRAVLPPRFGTPGFVGSYTYTYPRRRGGGGYAFPVFGGGGGGGARREFRREPRPGFLRGVVWRI